MNKSRINIKKIITAFFWLVATISMVVVLVAAINTSNDATCAGVEVEIRNDENFLFLDRKQVLNLLTDSRNAAIKGRPVAEIDLRKLEAILRKNIWVKDAQLFFDKDRVLQVLVKQKEPIARIFTQAGNSYYLDTSGTYLPLSQGRPAIKLPVYTGLPTKLKLSRQSDSLLLADILSINKTLIEDSFWSAQISQVSVTPLYEFEMVPLIGDHIILFGDGEESVKKIRQLEIFYRNVMAKTGFNYYSVINVKYDQQVIGKRRNAISTSVDKKRWMVNVSAAPLAVSSNAQAAETTTANLSHPSGKTNPAQSASKPVAIHKAIMNKQNN